MKGTRNEYKSGTFLTKQTRALKANLSSQTRVCADFGTLNFRHDIKIENSHRMIDFTQNTSLNSACYWGKIVLLHSLIHVPACHHTAAKTSP